jgi:hypothetical protein
MLYAETSRIRHRQMVWDLVIVAWVVLWVVLGLHLHDLVTVLAVPGEALSDAGTSIASGADRVAGALEGAPLIGAGIAAPFTALGEAGEDLAGVGDSTRQAAQRLALWLSVVVAGIAVAVVTVPYVAWRWRWSRRATAAARLRADPGTARLLALRAVVSRPLHELQDISADPLRDVEERPQELAALELRKLGLREPPPPAR